MEKDWRVDSMFQETNQPMGKNALKHGILGKASTGIYFIQYRENSDFSTEDAPP